MKKLLNFDKNPYYFPEKCGLQLFEGLDISDDPYDFDIFLIWVKKDDGTLWWDHDSGDSYTIPFDTDRHELKPLTEENLSEFEKILKNQQNIFHKQYRRILIKVNNYLKKRKKNN